MFKRPRQPKQLESVIPKHLDCARRAMRRPHKDQQYRSWGPGALQALLAAYDDTDNPLTHALRRQRRATGD